MNRFERTIRETDLLLARDPVLWMYFEDMERADD